MVSMCYLPERRKQLKPLSVVLTGNGTTLACAGYLIFEQDLTSFYKIVLFILEEILSVLWDRKYPSHTLSKSLWFI